VLLENVNFANSVFLALDKKQNDISLFEKFRRGDKIAFERIFENHYENLCNFACIFLKSDSKSEEVVADVFLNLWKKRSSLLINSSLKAYLYMSTRNAAISDLRKEKNRKLTHEGELNLKTVELSPETLLIRKEICDNFQEMIDSMPKQAALVFRLHKVDGLSYREISELLELSVKTVENHMGRALKTMREIYSKSPDIFSE